MPAPLEVRSGGFTPYRVVWSKNGFSIAWGNWEGEEPEAIAMRWDGKEGELGFPNSYGHPTWFLLPRELTLPILGMLITHGAFTEEEEEHLRESIKYSMWDKLDGARGRRG